MAPVVSGPPRRTGTGSVFLAAALSAILASGRDRHRAERDGRPRSRRARLHLDDRPERRQQPAGHDRRELGDDRCGRPGQSGGRAHLDLGERRIVRRVIPASGIGSGSSTTATASILTNRHVVDGTESIQVELNDGRILSGEIYGIDTLPTWPSSSSTNGPAHRLARRLGRPQGRPTRRRHRQPAARRTRTRDQRHRVGQGDHHDRRQQHPQQPHPDGRGHQPREPCHRRRRRRRRPPSRRAGPRTCCDGTRCAFWSFDGCRELCGRDGADPTGQPPSHRLAGRPRVKGTNDVSTEEGGPPRWVSGSA